MQPYYFPALDSTLDQRCLPLGYAFLGQEPDPELACDQPLCEVQSDQPVIRLNCGHTFHRGCLMIQATNTEHSYTMSEGVKCPVCYGPLCERMEELATTLNRWVSLQLNVQIMCNYVLAS